MTENWRGSLQGAINIYQGTVTMLAIFMGFAFTTLVEVYVAGKAPVVLVRILVVTILLLLAALLSFHNTAHRMIRHYQMVLPTSPVNTIGGVCMSLGLAGMVAAIAFMLWDSGLTTDALIVAICAGALMLAMINMRQMHDRADYRLSV